MHTTPQVIPNRPLFVSATQEEAVHLPKECALIITGIGTLNATIKLMDLLISEREQGRTPSRLINFGTVGALRDGLHGIYEVNRCHQHDFDHEIISEMNGKPYPNHIDLPTSGLLEEKRLATGDAFIHRQEDRERIAREAELVDMEGYAIVRVAQHLGLPVTLIKQVSDQANEDSAALWDEAVELGARELAQVAFHVAEELEKRS